MVCYFCKKDLSDAELINVVPLKRGDDTVYACTKHDGVLIEYCRQFGGTVESLKSVYQKDISVSLKE